MYQLCHNGLMPGKSCAQQKAEAHAMKEGRASKRAYHPGFDRRATDYCMLGATNEELAQLFGVSVSAIQKWLVARPSFARAVRKGREEADARVARSMFRAATGLKLKEVRTRLGENGQVLEKTETIKEQAPNVNAGTLWLTNRRGDRWRDRNVVDAGDSFDLAELVKEAMARADGSKARVIEGRAETVSAAPKR